MLWPVIARASGGIRSDSQVCDPVADYFLGMEDYPAAIGRHLVVIREHPENALAHYHLGFAYGVTGQHFETVGAALLWTLATGLGARFTPEIREAWAVVYSVLVKSMQEGMRQSEQSTLAVAASQA